MTDGRALNLSAGEPKFRQLERFLNNVRISIPSANGQRTKTIRGLIERAGMFVFSKNDGQESTVAVCFFISPSGRFIGLLISIKLHFQESYSIRIRFNDIFGVNISGKKNQASYLPNCVKSFRVNYTNEKSPSILPRRSLNFQKSSLKTDLGKSLRV
jgi:hypothetical protein